MITKLVRSRPSTLLVHHLRGIQEKMKGCRRKKDERKKWGSIERGRTDPSEDELER